MRRLLASIALATAAPLAAQSMDHGGHAMPEADPHAGHDMSAMMESPAPQATAAPAAPGDHYADRFYPAADMAAARKALREEHGGGRFSQVIVNIAEYRVQPRGDGYRWNGEAWFGSDVDRLVVKSEGEGAVHGGVEDAEVQALYARALDPYWNLQAGLRQDIGHGPSRSYATIGVEGLAPYWIEIGGALFLSDKGDLLARVEAYHDLRITRRLILQPRAEVNLAAQDVRASRIGAGVSDAELGLRLRYEIRPEFAPYVGISHERRFGQTARYVRADGDRARSTALVVGIRSWF